MATRSLPPGMSLIELVVALLLAALGLVAVAGAALLAQRTITRTAVTERMTREAASIMDSLAAHPHPASGERENRGLLIRWVVESDSLGQRLRLDAYHEAVTPLTFEGRHAPR